MYAASNVEWAFMNVLLTRDPESVAFIEENFSYGGILTGDGVWCAADTLNR